MGKDRIEKLNSKINSVEKRIKELDSERCKAKKQIEKWNYEIEKIQINEVEEYCKKIQNKYFKYVANNDEYTSMWLLYFDKFKEMYDDSGTMVGKSVSLTYNKNEMLESFMFDKNAAMLVNSTYDDAFNGYFKKNKLIETTKEAFDGAKKLIINVLNKN